MTVKVSSTFYSQSLPLTAAANAKRARAWRDGFTVQSATQAIGLVSVTGIKAVFSELCVDRDEPRVTFSRDNKPAPELLTVIQAAFQKVAAEDIARSDLRTRSIPGTLTGYCGYYTADEVKANKWHTDNWPGVRWTVAWGPPGSTRGAHGLVSASDVDPGGFLKADLIGRDRRLQEVLYPVGTVIRLYTKGDIHAGPPITGLRLFMAADLDV